MVTHFIFILFQHWNVFQQVPEVFILVPALLGLKGNLEMTLASRLSTQVRTFLKKVELSLIKTVSLNLSLVALNYSGQLFTMIVLQHTCTPYIIKSCIVIFWYKSEYDNIYIGKINYICNRWNAMHMSISVLKQF